MEIIIGVYTEETKNKLYEIFYSYCKQLQGNSNVVPYSVKENIIKYECNFEIKVSIKSGNSYINKITKNNGRANLEIICKDSIDNSQFDQDSKIFKKCFEKICFQSPLSSAEISLVKDSLHGFEEVANGKVI